MGLSDPIRSLALESGGGYRVFVTDQDATAAMQHVAEELHHQYLLASRQRRWMASSTSSR
jgi:hypothetical protein